MSPDKVTSFPCSRERDIEKTQVFCKFLLPGEGEVSAVLFRRKIEGQSIVVIRIMKRDFFVISLGTLPGEGTEHHGIFKAFAFMDSDNLHGLLIAFQPELVFL